MNDVTAPHRPGLFGSYLLQHRLAQGNTAEVFLARTMGEFPRLCAVKRILPQLTALPEFAERFRADASLLVNLHHGNVVQVLEVGTIDDQPFITMEHIDGIDLPQLIAQVDEQGPLPLEFALYVALEMIEGLSYLRIRRREERAAEEVSKDPAWPLEIMLGFDGVVKIVDLGSFGALRLGQQKPSRLFRSPGYAIPEVILKHALDQRSDIFTVGLALWECLSGERLLVDKPEAYIKAVLEGNWQAPRITREDVPEGIVDLIASMLDADPENRPPHMEAIRAPLVATLRQLSPSYGSATLSRLLWQRCSAQIAKTEVLTQTLVDASATVQATPQFATETYGRAIRSQTLDVDPLEIGQQIPGTRYRLVRPLGKGGSAEVFAAQHIDLDRQAAVKILSPKVALNERARAQFRREARACSRVQHPNIVDVLDFGELDDGRFFFAMELLDGQSLADILDRDGALPASRVLGIARQVCKAAQAAHENGIVHRDIKPANIMLVERDGRPDFLKVVDFGVMAFADDNQKKRVGTPGYMAPEQVRGAPPTTAMDIYALGMTIYECLTGGLPYPTDSLKAFSAAQAKGQPPALASCGEGVPEPLARAVHRALERNPAARQLSMADLESDLLRAQEESGISSPWDDLREPQNLTDERPRNRRPSLPRRIIQSPQSNGTFWIAGALSLMLIASALLWWKKPSQKNVAPKQDVAAGKLRSATAKLIAAAPTNLPDVDPNRITKEEEHKQPHILVEKEVNNTPVEIEKRAASTKAAIPPTAIRNTKRLLASASKALASGELKKAESLYQQALRANPRSAAGFRGLAGVAFDRGNYVRTVELASRSIKLDSRSVSALLLLGDAQFKLHRLAQAKRAWKRVLQLRPKNRSATRRLERLRSSTN
jgi:serine/threonine protein kinase